MEVGVWDGKELKYQGRLFNIVKHAKLVDGQKKLDNNFKMVKHAKLVDGQKK